MPWWWWCWGPIHYLEWHNCYMTVGQEVTLISWHVIKIMKLVACYCHFALVSPLDLHRHLTFRGAGGAFERRGFTCTRFNLLSNLMEKHFQERARLLAFGSNRTAYQPWNRKIPMWRSPPAHHQYVIMTSSSRGQFIMMTSQPPSGRFLLSFLACYWPFVIKEPELTWIVNYILRSTGATNS